MSYNEYFNYHYKIIIESEYKIKYPLHWAAKNDDYKSCEQLLQKYNPNEFDVNGCTAYYYVLQGSNIPLSVLFEEYGATYDQVRKI